MITTFDKIDRTEIVYLKQIYSDPLIKMKKYKDAHTMLGPALDKNGNPVTGLTEDRTIIVDGKKVVVKGTRALMERELDMAEGSLSHKAPFWDMYSIRIGSDPIKLDLQDPEDFLKYVFAHAQSIVANGISEIGKDSSSEFVLYSEEQEAKVRVSERKSLSRAYILADKLDIETKINILSVYGLILDASSPSTIEDKIGEKIDEDPKKFLAIADDGQLEYLSLITKCLDKGVLTMKDGSILHGEVSVGYDKKTAAHAVSTDTTLQAILKAKLSGDLELISKSMTPKEPKK